MTNILEVIMSELTVQESRIELQKLADEVAAYYTTDAMEERTEKFTVDVFNLTSTLVAPLKKCTRDLKKRI